MRKAGWGQFGFNELQGEKGGISCCWELYTGRSGYPSYARRDDGLQYADLSHCPGEAANTGFSRRDDMSVI